MTGMKADNDLKDTRSYPVIGISCTFDGGRYSIPQDYINAVRAAGGFPVVLPLPQDEGEAFTLLKNCSGLLLSGGVDLDPALYGEYTQFATESICKRRDRGEYALLKAAVSLHRPVLGICRGIQLINVYFGGTLYRDIPCEYRSLPGGGNPHRQTLPFPEGGHEVTYEGELWPIPEKTVRVNSYHHQAVRIPAPGFRVLARSTVDGLIESIYSPETASMPLVAAVQWHPELIQHVREDQRDIFRFFIDNTRTVVL